MDRTPAINGVIDVVESIPTSAAPPRRDAQPHRQSKTDASRQSTFGSPMLVPATVDQHGSTFHLEFGK